MIYINELINNNNNNNNNNNEKGMFRKKTISAVKIILNETLVLTII